MQEVFVNQANEVSLPVVNKDGTPVVSGTVNFYLKDKDGTNAGKWYRGSDTSWQSSLSIAGQATLDDDGHWHLTLPTAVWEYGTAYRLFAKESGDLHIPVGDNIIVIAKQLDRLMKAWAAGTWRDKSGSPGTYELLDADDGVTVVLEMTLSTTTPYRSITVKI